MGTRIKRFGLLLIIIAVTLTAAYWLLWLIGGNPDFDRDYNAMFVALIALIPIYIIVETISWLRGRRAKRLSPPSDPRVTQPNLQKND